MNTRNKLTSTIDFNYETEYQEAITRMLKWHLDYRNIEDFKNMLDDLGGISWVAEKIRDCLDNDKDLKYEMLEIFISMWEWLKTWFTKSEIREAVWRLVSFNSDWIVPIEKLEAIDNTFLSDQTKWHTNAFKDIALQIITKLISIVVKKKNIQNISNAISIKEEYEENQIRWETIQEYIEKNNIKRPKLTFIINQVSTTWDTAPAAWEWIKLEDFVLLIMWYPANESTFAQITQMLKLDAEAGNIIAQWFNRGFSHIQNAMKEWNTEKQQKLLKKIIEDWLWTLIEQYWFEIEVDSWTFNSINQSRIDAQTIYHTVLHAQAEAREIVKPGWDLIEVIPSWNGWHMLSVLFARLASWKKWTTLITCNENEMFHDMIVKWVFQRPQKTSEAIDCPSVSMVIQEPNNIERLFTYAFWPKRAKQIRNKYEKYDKVILTIEEKRILKEDLGIFVEVISNSEELETIHDTYIKSWRFICPHTANALCWLNKYREKSWDNNVALVSETASAWKFISAIASALSWKRWEELLSLYEKYNKIQNTKEWNIKLIWIIEDNIKRLWGTFDIDMIPKNLQKLFNNPLKEGKSIAPKEFPKIVSESVRGACQMFEVQVQKIINELEKANNIIEERT